VVNGEDGPFWNRPNSKRAIGGFSWALNGEKDLISIDNISGEN
jgi:hypothetical protein